MSMRQDWIISREVEEQNDVYGEYFNVFQPLDMFRFFGDDEEVKQFLADRVTEVMDKEVYEPCSPESVNTTASDLFNNQYFVVANAKDGNHIIWKATPFASLCSYEEVSDNAD